MDTDALQTIQLNNGVALPALGLGFQTPPDVTQAAVEEALRGGYRLIDTAASYMNEPEVGAAIAASGIDRSQLFIQTKVWVTNYTYDGALHAFDVSTRKLGIDTVDLYLLHQPLPQDFDATAEAYRALERLLEEGRVRAIGAVSPELQSRRTSKRSRRGWRLFRPSTRSRCTRITPSRAASDPCAGFGIATQAWSPLGGVYVYRAVEGQAPQNALRDPVITGSPQRHDKRRPRSSCAGTSTADARPFRSPFDRSALRRISTSSTSR